MVNMHGVLPNDKRFLPVLETASREQSTFSRLAPGTSSRVAKNGKRNKSKGNNPYEQGPRGAKLIRFVMNQLGESGMAAGSAEQKPETPKDGSAGLDTSQIALISKENDRLTDLHREQCEMFSAEMQYLKQKLNHYKKENEQLTEAYRQNELLMIERQREKDIIHEKSNLLNDKIEAYRAQVEQLYAQTKSDQERLAHLEDCLAKLRESQQKAVAEQQSKEKEYASIMEETEKCKNELSQMDTEIEELQDQKIKLTRAQQEVNNKRNTNLQGLDFESQRAANVEQFASVDMLEDAYTEIASLRNELAELENTHTDLVDSQNETMMREELFTWRTRYERLREMVDAMELSQSESKEQASDSQEIVKARKARLPPATAISRALSIMGDTEQEVPGTEWLNSHSCRRFFTVFKHWLTSAPRRRPISLKKYRLQQRREKLLQREVAQEVLQHPMDALDLLTSLQKVFGGDDSGGLKARRKALARLRQQKGNLRKSIWKQRSRMLSLVSLYKRQLRKQWTDRKVQEDDQRHRIYSLEAKIADLKSRAETQIDGCSWLATVHNFFVTVMAQLSTEIEEDGNDIQAIQRAIDDEGIDASGLKKLMLDILSRDQQENLARLAHVQSGVHAAEKNEDTLTFLAQASIHGSGFGNVGLDAYSESEKSSVASDEIAQVGVPYTRQLAGAATVDADIQTDDVGFMSCREICVCEKVFHGVADSEILISLINEQIIVIRVLIDDLEYPLYHCVMLDQIKFPFDEDELANQAQHALAGSPAASSAKFTSNPTGKRDASRDQVAETICLADLYQDFFGWTGQMNQDEDVIWKKIGQRIVQLVDLEHVRGWPRLILMGQSGNQERVSELTVSGSIEMACIRSDEQLLAETISVRGVPVEFSMLRCKRSKFGIFFVHLRLYEPLSDWELWCTVSFSQLVRFVGLPSIQAMQEAVQSGNSKPILRAVESFFGPHLPSEQEFVRATVGSVHPLTDMSMTLKCPAKTRDDEIENPLLDLKINFSLNSDIHILLSEAS